MDNDSADSRRVAGRSMSVDRQPGKPGWLATVVNLTGDTARRLVVAERSGWRSGRLTKKSKCWTLGLIRRMMMRQKTCPTQPPHTWLGIHHKR